MSRPSDKLAKRYSLRLSETWREWFDQDLHTLSLPGAMRNAVPVEDLLLETPPQIWAGFMLPDTLPILGNEYGDWICVRIGPDAELKELLYWYHGGGDWIPVGSTLAEVVLHDVVDQFRRVRKQMIRGASESKFLNEYSFLERLAAS